MQFIFFDGEEAFVEWSDSDSLYGSRAHANLLTSKYGQSSFDKIDLFVLLDLLGGSESNFPNFFSATSKAYNMISKIETMLLQKKMLNIKKKTFFNNAQGWGGVQDDHIPFLNKSLIIK